MAAPAPRGGPADTSARATAAATAAAATEPWPSVRRHSRGALWPPSPRREAPDVYFLRRLSPGAALARYGALAAAGVGAGMLVEQWIKKKVAGALTWRFTVRCGDVDWASPASDGVRPALPYVGYQDGGMIVLLPKKAPESEETVPDAKRRGYHPRELSAATREPSVASMATFQLRARSSRCRLPTRRGLWRRRRASAEAHCVVSELQMAGRSSSGILRYRGFEAFDNPGIPPAPSASSRTPTTAATAPARSPTPRRRAAIRTARAAPRLPRTASGRTAAAAAAAAGALDLPRLQAAILRAPSVAGACRDVEAFARLNRELVPAFLKACFPLLLRKLFGFGDTEAPGTFSPSPSAAAGGWLALASRQGSEADAKALVSLLSPEGPLFQGVVSTDRQDLIRFVFPTEHLPLWMQQLLGSEQGALLLCQEVPFFRQHIAQEPSGAMQAKSLSPEVHLSLLEYFFFWFAYYAARDSSSRDGRITVAGAALRSRFAGWKPSFPGLPHGQEPLPPTPYLDLLQLYLKHFLPLTSPDGAGMGGPLAPASPQVEALLCALVEFLLRADDPAPLTPSLLQLPQASSLRSTVMQLPTSYRVPNEDLLNSVQALLIYLSTNPALTALEAPSLSMPLPARLHQGRGHSLPPLPSHSSSQSLPHPSAVLQRPLYRFFLRALTMWPQTASIGRLPRVVDVWVAYLEPWEARAYQSRGRTAKLSPSSPLYVSPGALLRTISKASSSRTASSSPSLPAAPRGAPVAGGFSSIWQGWVLANFPFYSVLLCRLLEFCLGAVAGEPVPALQAVQKVLSMLDRNSLLTAFLRNLSSSLDATSLAPAFQAQVQEWEEASGQYRPGGSVVAAQATAMRLRMFGQEEGSPRRLLQAFIVQAEDVVSRGPPLNAGGDSAQSGRPSPSPLELLRDIQGMADRVFGLRAGLESGAPHHGYAPTTDGHGSSADKAAAPEHEHAPAARRAQAAFQTRPSGRVRYKGDWMRRPVESYELGFLVQLLVPLSDAVNASLGLGPDQPQEAQMARRSTGTEEHSGDPASEDTVPSRGKEAEGMEGRSAEAGKAAERQAKEQHPQHGGSRETEPEVAERQLGPGVDGVGSSSGRSGAGVGSQAAGTQWAVDEQFWRRVGEWAVQLPLHGLHLTRALAATAGRAALQEARRRGWRVNLRFLAERQLAVLLLVLLAALLVARALLRT
eukprot:SM000135S27011  [mRNA]  locus=s135:233540:242896:+ [translate_table: standard]